MCLAQIAAMSGQRVVLVDCDLRRHSLNRFLGLSPKVGLLQVLSGEADWRSVVEMHERTGVHVIPVCGGSFTARDVFGTEAMERLVSDLSEAYDFVVLDCAPVLALAETSVAVAHADGVVMVCQWNKTPAKAVRAAIEQLEVTHARVIGVVLHGLDPHASGRSKTYRTLYMSRAANAYFQH
jgi:Mrp family chromosome partitioning ATPase